MWHTGLMKHIVEQVLGVAGVKLAPTQQMQCSIVGSQCRRGSEVARYLVERKSRFGVGAGDCVAWTREGSPLPGGVHRRKAEAERFAAQNKWNFFFSN